MFANVSGDILLFYCTMGSLFTLHQPQHKPALYLTENGWSVLLLKAISLLLLKVKYVFKMQTINNNKLSQMTLKLEVCLNICCILLV